MNPADGVLLDRALVLWFPGPASATGEDIAEIHLHGGRAVIAAVLNALADFKGLRHAEAGEFTRRAFENGRIDLAEAEALGDLLSAETELQRRSAIAQVGGALHRLTDSWSQEIVKLSAQVEAAIDFSDEGDVGTLSLDPVRDSVRSVVADILKVLADPPAERLRDGLRVAIIGPPNSGKSTLLNCLISRDAAIVSDIPGTTRDVIEAPVILRGLPFVFVDTAGIREDIVDPIERLGVDRSFAESRSADIILSLGGWTTNVTANVIAVAAKSDLSNDKPAGSVRVSAKTGEGITDLLAAICSLATQILPGGDQASLNARHRAALLRVVSSLRDAAQEGDELILAEHLRLARRALADVTGGNDAEDVLDALFGKFCIGK
ncbi:tRNA uridine-5-carboxymethylaminomethyl(34) synthesis GTPase MnmE [soil metagenome]